MGCNLSSTSSTERKHVQTYLEYKKAITEKRTQINYEFTEAVCNNNTERVCELLKAYPNATCHASIADGRSALHLAVYRTSIEMIQLLLDSRFNINSRDEFGETPLFSASRNSRLQVVSFLLDNKADATALDYGGHGVLPSERRDEKIWQLLYKHGARVTSLDTVRADFLESLSLAEETQGRPAAALRKSVFCSDAFDMVVSGKIYPVPDVAIHAVNRSGYTPLALAVIRDDLEMTRHLISIRADIHWQGWNGCTLLHYAAFNGNTDMVQCLLEARVDCLAINKNGENALHILCQYGRNSLSISRILLAHGDKIKEQREFTMGHTPLEMANKLGVEFWNR
jgi:ankyrin repeat protein